MPNAHDFAIEKIAPVISPVLDDMGLELVDIEYLSEHGKWILRIYIDKAGGVTVGDCARISREVSDLIDVEEIFQHEYVLEVSSPGLNRRLKREKDFLKALGKKIKVKMVAPINGRRNFIGYLHSLHDGSLYIDLGEDQIRLSLRDVQKANLIFEFND